MAFGMAAPGLRAQYANPPAAYTHTQISTMMGAPATTQVTRDGSKALVDMGPTTPNGPHRRTLYDLQTNTSYTWDPAAPAGCGAANFQGDWGDPFAQAAELRTQLAGANPKQLGNETVNGFATKVSQGTDPKSGYSFKAWQETQYGLIAKLEMTAPGGKPLPMPNPVIEMKQFSAAKPPASALAMPPSCAAATPPAHVPTNTERVATEIGGKSEDLVEAIMGPGSKNSCTMLLRIVGAGAMQPVASGYALALDLNVDLDHPAHYVMGGAAKFSGGSIQDYTGQMQNGLLRVDNVPEHFDVEMTYPGGGASALIYRKCEGPQTVLLYVLKNPAKLSDGGDWMWVKSGKFATVPGR